MNDFSWTDPTMFVYGFTVFLIGVIIPILIISFVLRIIIRSFRKTTKTIFRR